MVYIFWVLFSVILHEATEWNMRGKEKEKNIYHIARWIITITDLSRAVKNIIFLKTEYIVAKSDEFECWSNAGDFKVLLFSYCYNYNRLLFSIFGTLLKMLESPAECGWLGNYGIYTIYLFCTQLILHSKISSPLLEYEIYSVLKTIDIFHCSW